MDPQKNIENQLEQLAQAIPSGTSFVDGVMNRIETSSDSLQKTQTIHINFVRRLFMKPLVKFAAAAIVLIAAILSLTLFNKTVTAAYALEQTLQACHSVRTIHIREYHPNQETPILSWAEFSLDGKAIRLRLSIPAWDEPQAGPKEIVWQDNVSQIWLKKHNSLVTQREGKLAEQFQAGMEKVDPKWLIQKLDELRQRDEAQIQIEQPDDMALPIQITATFKKEDPLLGSRLVARVDQATKLVLSIRLFKTLETGYEETVYIEFYDYNQPFDEDVFTLNIPDNAEHVNSDSETEPGSFEQDQMTNNEIAVEIVRRYWQKIIENNYEAAGQLLSGIASAQRVKEIIEAKPGGKILRIVSVGPATPHPISEKLINVPCVIEFEKNGQIEQKKFNLSVIRENNSQPVRWSIFSGIL